MQGPSSGWLFHIDSRNVLATAWTPVCTDHVVTGFRVRLLETSGRAARTKLQSCHPIRAADRRDFVGGSLGTCAIETGAAVLDVGANEWIEVEAKWSGGGSGTVT